MPTLTDDIISDDELRAAFGPPRRMDIAERQLMNNILRKLTDEEVESVSIGPYELGDRIGEGGMGVVYQAMDADLDRLVAVKVMRCRSPSRDTRARQRSIQEAKTMAEVVHRNVVHVYKVGFDEDEGQAWISMEFVRGPTLRTWLHQTARGWKKVLDIFVQAGRGLAAAHERKVVHGDFKPDNVLIDDKGVPKVTDFGLALLYGDRGLAGGTPEYMAPEQYLERDRDALSDQFSFCVALFEGLTEHHPYSKMSFDEFASTVQDRDPGATTASIRREYRRSLFINSSKRALRWPRLPARIPVRIRKALTKGLDPEPHRRFGSMTELLDQIDPRLARKRRNLGIGAAALIFVSAASTAAIAARLDRNERSSICQRAEDEYSEVWNGEVRAELANALSEGAANAIGDTLELHRARWSTAYANACEATLMKSEEQTWAPISQCLDDHLLRLEVGLEDALTATAGDAVVRIAELAKPSPASCLLDGTALFGATAASAEDSNADAISLARARLAALRVDEAARRYEAGIVKADREIETARVIGYEPLLAEAYYQRGRLKLQQARYESPLREGWGTPGIDDLGIASTYAMTSFHRSTAWDVTIFRAKILSVLGTPPLPIDYETLLTKEEDGKLLLRDQRAELIEMQALELRRRTKFEADPIDALERAIAKFEEAESIHADRGDRVALAKVRGNWARAEVELGAQLFNTNREAALAAYSRASVLIQQTLEFWETFDGGYKYVASQYASLINAYLRVDRERAKSLYQDALGRFAGEPDAMLKILLPGILAYSGTPEALGVADLAQQTMAELESSSSRKPSPKIQAQLRLFSLGALIDDEKVSSQLGRVERWANALEKDLGLVDMWIPTRKPLANAYLGNAHALQEHWAEARDRFEEARADGHWKKISKENQAKLLLDLSEAYLKLRDEVKARGILSEAEPMVEDLKKQGSSYAKKVLSERARTLRESLSET